MLEIELQYHGLAVRVYSGDDGATSSKNFRQLLPGNPRDDRAYLRTYGMTRPNSLISPDILHGFSQSFHCMKALYVQMTDLYLIFQFVKGSFHGNQIILPL